MAQHQRPRIESDDMIQAIGRYDQVVLAMVGTTGWLLGSIVATIARLEVTPGALPWTGMFVFAAVAALLDALFGNLTGVYRRTRRVGSFDEALAITQNIGWVTLIAVVLNIHVLDRAIPVGASLGAAVLALCWVGTSRLVWRTFRQRTTRGESDATRIIVFGAGEAGAKVIETLLDERGHKYQPVAILDDEVKRSRLSIRGVPVAGTSRDMVTVATEYAAEVLLIALGTRSGRTVQRLVEQAHKANLEVKVIPRASELFGAVGVDDIREVTREDLLGRSQIEVDLETMADSIRGRTVLITGAGGSIGSELCRQVQGLGPKHLVMLDRDESALHAVEMSIHGRALLDRRNLVVANIRDLDRMHEVFEEWRPHVVFHAAALKHLPLLEMHPLEGVKTNVIGSLNLLQAAAATGVERFVNVSTDKAADPTSVLGYTKRIAERLTAQFSLDHDGVYVSVRFGNVLGSRGSMLTAFNAQIDAGGPVTVTHRDVTRYFMTVEEAVSLVVQAGALGRDAEALVLDMGEPVRIDDVARRLIEVSGREIEIEYTGLRQGEKLHEILLGKEEDDDRPSHPLLSQVPVKPLTADEALSTILESSDLIGAMIPLCANQARRWAPVPDELDLRPEALEQTLGATAPDDDTVARSR